MDNYGYSYNYNPIEFKSIISQGADINHTFGSGGENALMYVIKKDRTESGKQFMRDLLDLGINVNHKTGEGFSALMCAVEAHGNNGEIIQMLINKGADINAVDANGVSALTLANVKRRKEAAQVLAKAGAKRDLTAEHFYQNSR